MAMAQTEDSRGESAASGRPYVDRAGRTSVTECYRHGLEVFIDHFVMLLIMGFVVGAAFAGSWGMLRVPLIGGLLSFAFGAFISTPLTWGFYDVCLRAVRGNGVEAQAIVRVYDRYYDAVVAAAITTAIVLLGFVLLIVPGIIVLCRFAFVPYLIVEGRLSASDAIWESVELTAGHGWSIFGLLVCRFLLILIGLATFGLLLVPGAVWSDLAIATYYHRAVEARPPPGWRPAAEPSSPASV